MSIITILCCAPFVVVVACCIMVVVNDIEILLGERNN